MTKQQLIEALKDIHEDAQIYTLDHDVLPIRASYFTCIDIDNHKYILE